MIRLVALLLFALLLWLVLEGALQVARRLAGQARKGTMPRRPGPSAVAGEELVRCAACGVHVPRSRALPPASVAAATASPGGPPADLYCSDRCWRSSPLAS
jgi:hypothetical protein